MRTTRDPPLAAAPAGVARAAAAAATAATAARAAARQLGGSRQPATLNGAGATFAAPVYQQWRRDFKDQGITVNYQGVGSGAGIAQFTAGHRRLRRAPTRR